MNIKNIDEELSKQLVKEGERLKEQAKLVDRLGKEFAVQSQIYKNLYDKIRAIKEALSGLNAIAECDEPFANIPESKELVFEDPSSEELRKLLSEAADIAIQRGLIVPYVATHHGKRMMDNRKLIITRTFNTIFRHASSTNYIEYIRNLSDEEIMHLRDVGKKKTAEVIKIARSIIKGESINEKGTVYDAVCGDQAAKADAETI